MTTTANEPARPVSPTSPPGESVWNGWFFITVLKAFAELAGRRGDAVPFRDDGRAHDVRVTLGHGEG
jgi:hypothetical protein